LSTPAAHELTLQEMNFDPPCWPEEALRAIAAEHFGIHGRCQPLPGERDQNARISTAGGDDFVLKISSARARPEVVDFHAQALLHIAAHDAGLPVPRMVPLSNGGVIVPIHSATGVHQVRMLTWLPGVCYQDGVAPTRRGLRAVGAFLARLDQALQNFQHPAAGYWMPWDVTNGLIFKPQLQGMLSARVRTMLKPVWLRLEQQVYPQLAGLRRQVIHQDAHAANLLRLTPDDEAVAGLIDFGDMVHGPLICELAVTIADFLNVHADPLRVMVPICEGFHSLIPLAGAEIAILLDLVIARLILTLQLFEFRRRHMAQPPDFVTRDQPGIIAALEALLALDGEVFTMATGEACR